MANCPHLAIAFFIYMEKTERTDKEVALKVAWKHYLKYLGVDRPSLFTPEKDDVFSQVEIYFLREVCTQETMELGGAFGSQLDLDKERMQICVNLAKFDVDNSEFYTQEIVDLTRRINIEEGVQYLESSRIFVDEIGIQKWANKYLESQFLRYVDYHEAGLFTSVRELEAEIKKIAITAKNRKAALTSYLDSYDVSAETLLEDVLRQIATAFLQLPRFGLDAFLSSRVRHGSFVGYLRGPLENRRIVTKKNSDTRKYNDNDILLDKWQVFNEKDRRLINGKLANFSEVVDNLLEEAVLKWLHVNSATHPQGMVWFGSDAGTGAHIVKRWLIILKATLTAGTTLEHLIGYSFHNFFWPAVERSLINLQIFVTQNLGATLASAIDNLVASVEPHLNESQRRAARTDILLVRTELINSLARVALWFDLPKQSTHMLSMSLQRCLEIGLISAQNINPNFKPKVNWYIGYGDELNINGPGIGAMNDVGFVVFANILKHSGFDDEKDGNFEKLNIDIRIDGNSDAVTVRVENDIHASKDLGDLTLGIDVARQKIAKRDFDAVTRGTGLTRLAITLGRGEYAGAAPVEFGVGENGKFFVEFNVPRGIFSVETEHEKEQNINS
jgi:hypothetical protein